MKLFLHWLAWDLRRFRWQLLGWVASLAALSAWIWHLNAHLLTVEPKLFGYTEYLAAAVGIVELCILIVFMGSDPAGGTQAIWKTRPPTGYAVAGAKLFTVFLLFLLLPLFSWWAVTKLCGLELHRAWKWGINSWIEFIWWSGAMAISALVLAASVARGAGSIVGRLMAGIAVLVLALLTVGPVLRASQLAGVLPTLAGRILGGWLNMRTPWLWISCSVLFFILMRRTRTPHPFAGVVALMLPLLLCVAGDFIPRRQHKESAVNSIPPLDPEIAGGLRVSTQGMNSGFYYSNRYMAGSSYDGMVAWPLRLVIDGLPEDCMAYGRWIRMKLAAPDGRTVETAMAGSRYESFDEPSGDSIQQRFLTTVGLVFRAADLAPLSLAACHGEGLLELIVAKKTERSIPLRPGERITTRGEAEFMLSAIGTTQFAGATVPWVEATLADWDRGWLSVEKKGPGGKTFSLELRTEEMNWRSGYFIQRERGYVRFGTAGVPRGMAHARLARSINNGKPDGWSAVRSWYQSIGRSEIFVTLDQFIFPRQNGDERPAESILAGLRIPESATPGDAVKIIRYAFIIAQEREDESAAIEAQLKRLLNETQREHLTDLLNLAEPAHSEVSVPSRPYNHNLYRRLAELLLPEDVPALRAKTLLFAVMKPHLAAQGHISKSEAESSAWESATDEQLAMAWEKGGTDSLVVLKQAALRGLKWTGPAIQEIISLMPGGPEAWEVGDFMSRISDCPKDRRLSIDWLRQYAGRLTWDAAAKRWVLPPNP